MLCDDSKQFDFVLMFLEDEQRNKEEMENYETNWSEIVPGTITGQRGVNHPLPASNSGHRYPNLQVRPQCKIE